MADARVLRSLALLFEEAQSKIDSSQAKESQPCCNLNGLFLSKETFLDLLMRPQVIKLLEELGIEEADGTDLFDALDGDDNGYIELEELVEGFAMMRGKARRADSVATRIMLNTFVKKMALFERSVLGNQRALLIHMTGTTDPPVSESRRSPA